MIATEPRGGARRAAARAQQPAAPPLGLYAELVSGSAFTAPRGLVDRFEAWVQ